MRAGGSSSWLPTGGLLPIHDTTGVTDALMSGSFAGVSLLMSCTSNDGTASYGYDPTGQLLGAQYASLSLRERARVRACCLTNPTRTI